MPGYLPVWPPMIESPSFLHSWWKDLQYFAKLASLRVGGRLKSKSPNWGENPLVARSEANRWTDSHAEALGPSGGMNDNGSEVATRTRLRLSRTIELSRPKAGPTTSRDDEAPRDL